MAQARKSIWPQVNLLRPERWGAKAAGGVAGLIAGLAYIAAQMVFSTILRLDGPLAPLQRIAAILLGPDALPPGHVPVVELTMGMLIHLPLSLVFGFVIADRVRGFGANSGALLGAIAGLLLFFGCLLRRRTLRLSMVPGRSQPGHGVRPLDVWGDRWRYRRVLAAPSALVTSQESAATSDRRVPSAVTIGSGRAGPRSITPAATTGRCGHRQCRCVDRRPTRSCCRA